MEKTARENQLFSFFFDIYTICATKLQNTAQINPRQTRKSGTEGKRLKLDSEFLLFLTIFDYQT